MPQKYILVNSGSSIRFSPFVVKQLPICNRPLDALRYQLMKLDEENNVKQMGQSWFQARKTKKVTRVPSPRYCPPLFEVQPPVFHLVSIRSQRRKKKKKHQSTTSALGALDHLLRSEERIWRQISAKHSSPSWGVWQRPRCPCARCLA